MTIRHAVREVLNARGLSDTGKIRAISMIVDGFSSHEMILERVRAISETQDFASRVVSRFDALYRRYEQSQESELTLVCENGSQQSR